MRPYVTSLARSLGTWFLRMDEYDQVGAGVVSRHALGKSAYLISVGVGPRFSRFWVGNELLVF